MRNRKRWLLDVLWFLGFLELFVTIRGALARLKNDLAVWADIRAFPALAAIAGLDCLAGLVVGRRFDGGPPLHLTNARVAVAAVAVAALAVAGRWWLSRIEREPPARWLRLVLSAVCVLPMLALLSLTNSQHSPWIVSFASALAVASGGAVLLWNHISPVFLAPAVFPASSIAVMLPFSTAVEPTDSETKNTAKAETLTTSHASHASASDEWMKRTRGASGQVTLEGQAVAEFAAGQSVVTVHIPFCPAFDRLPGFSCEVVNEPSVRARQPAVFRYGARLELKRTGDTIHAARLEIRYRATESAAKSSRAA